MTLDRKTYLKAVKQASATIVLAREEEEDWLACFNDSKLGHVNQFVPEIFWQSQGEKDSKHAAPWGYKLPCELSFLILSPEVTCQFKLNFQNRVAQKHSERDKMSSVNLVNTADVSSIKGPSHPLAPAAPLRGRLWSYWAECCGSGRRWLKVMLLMFMHAPRSRLKYQKKHWTLILVLCKQEIDSHSDKISGYWIFWYPFQICQVTKKKKQILTSKW